MAMTGIVTITMDDVYKMPTSQKDKYLTLCKEYNDEVEADLPPDIRAKLKATRDKRAKEKRQQNTR